MQNLKYIWDKFKRQALYGILTILITFAASLFSDGTFKVPEWAAPLIFLGFETAHRVVRDWLGATPVEVDPVTGDILH